MIATPAETIGASCKNEGFDAKYHALSIEALRTTLEQFSEKLQADWALRKEAIKASGMAAE